MIKAILNLTLILFVAYIDGQPSLDWAIGMGNSGLDAHNSYDNITSSVIDSEGNIYVTGYFMGTVDFNPSGNVNNLTSAGGNDIFLAKYDPNGNNIYAKSIGGTGQDEGIAIALDETENPVIVGNFEETVDFDPGSGTHNITCIGGRYVFIAKFSTNGDFVFAKSISRAYSPDTPYDLAIAVDNDGDIYIAGSFHGTANFSIDANLTSAGEADVFLAKYDLNGNYLASANIARGPGNASAQAIALDNIGNIYVTGYFLGTSDFNPGIGTNNLTSNGQDDAFLSRYTDLGESFIYFGFQFARQIGSSLSDICRDIQLTSSGVYVTGHFSDEAVINDGSSNTTLQCAGTWDAFLIKFSLAGVKIFANVIGGTGYDVGFKIAIDSDENIYVLGTFTGIVDFNPITFPGSVDNHLSNGSYDIFLSKYDSSGFWSYTKSIGGPAHDRGNTMSISNDGDIILAGYFYWTVDFDPDNGQTLLTSQGAMDMFIAQFRLSEICLNTHANLNINTCNASYILNGTSYGESGTFTQIIPNKAGCDSTITLNLNIQIINTEVSLSGNTLTALQQGATYQWLDCDNNNSEINGATSQSFTSTNSGNYSVEVSIDECSSVSDCYNVIITSIEEYNSNSINIFPNPTNGTTYFDGASCNMIVITDISGKVLMTDTSFSSPLRTVDLRNLSNGIYFVLIKDKDQKIITTKKIRVKNN